MAQNPLHGPFIGPQRVQFGRNPATEPVPAVPLELDGLDRGANHPLRQLVHVHPFAVAMVEYVLGGGVVPGRAIGIEDRRQLGDHRNWLTARAGLGLIDKLPPRRAIHQQLLHRIVRPFQPSQLTLAQPGQGCGSDDCLGKQRQDVENPKNLRQVVGLRFPRLACAVGDRCALYRVSPVERAFIFRVREDSAQHRLNVLQRALPQFVFASNRASNGPVVLDGSCRQSARVLIWQLRSKPKDRRQATAAS